MRIDIAPGWRLIHLTDRTAEARKDDHAYRRFTGRDGYVRVRAEPGMSRDQMLEQLRTMAERTDEALAKRVAKRLMPSARSLIGYQNRQRDLARAFGVPHEDERTYRV